MTSRLKILSSVAASALLLWGLGAWGGASAEEARLDARAAEHVLKGAGFRDIAQPRRQGMAWIARAVGPDGRRMLAVVDAETGEVTGLTPVDGPPLPPRMTSFRF